MQCWKCGHQLDLPAGSMPFNFYCDKCLAWQHCCKNCRHYKPGLPNDCAIPDTDPISDRETKNFCEFFNALGKVSASSAPSKQDIEKRLFGDNA